VALTPACGDGVGQPIVVRDTSPGSGGSGESAGSGYGGSASGRFGTPSPAGNGEGRGGTLQGGAGQGGAGQGGATAPELTCSGITDWPVTSKEAEDEFFEALNYAREIGTTCASGSVGTASPPLAMSGALRCAARLHSRDMAERRFFDHVNPEGVGPEDRMRRAGAAFRVAGESIARSENVEFEQFPWRAFEELFATGGSECQNLTDPRFDAVGIGLFEGYWTLDFTGP
jgi:uncharacterized protein YkwD